MLQAIFEGKSGLTDPGLLSIVGLLLDDNVKEGFGKTFLQVDFATPDAAMLTRLTRDTWHFSAAKDYQQLRDMTLALKDDAGKLRTFADFREAASGINDSYNKTWLKAEYDHAVGSSTMASQWVEFQRNAKLMPFLRYSTVGDARVRESHRALDGITRKIDDAFWTTHYPPNGWRCRCDANQLPGSAKETDLKDIPSVPIQPMFRTNLAASGMIYPKGHPYYDGIPADVLRDAIWYLPKDAPYNDVYAAKNGSKVKMHFLHGIDEAENNIATAKILADQGLDVKLLPNLEDAPNSVRKYIYGTNDFVSKKNPDAMINKRLVDFKNTKNSNSTAIHNAIEYGQEQADWVIIHIPEVMDEKEIYRYVKGKFKQARYIDDVWVINKTGEPLKYDRELFGLPAKAKRPTD